MRSDVVSRSRQTEQAEERTRPATSESQRFWTGVVGGAVATFVMTAFRLPISRSLPPTARFWAQYVAGGDPSDHPVAGAVLHVVYGVAAGVPFALVLGRRREPSERAAESRDAAAGVVYGLVLSVFGLRVVLGRLLDMDLAPDERLVFHLGHVVYGLTLGTWIGSRTTE